MKQLCVLFFAVLFSTNMFGQPDIYSLPAIDTIYQDYIKTIEFHHTGDELSMPVIEINTGQLSMRFDDHYGEYIDYFYTVVHCDRNWNFTEDVEIGDYLSGPQELQIEEFGASVGTFASYTNYGFQFPNQDIGFLWSGNYLLVVYDADDTVAFTRRFYVVDEQVNIINPRYTRPNGEGQYHTHQSFEFNLGIKKLDAINPVNEIYVTGFQNRLNERLLPFVQPFRVNKDVAIFEIGNQFTFEGTKEYREFDTRELQSGTGRNIHTIERTNTETNALLELDGNRSVKANFTNAEANGGFIIRNNDRRTGEKNTSSQYVNTIFTLKSPIELPGAVYILGEFSDYKAYPQYKMHYLPVEKIYTLEIPLKQGYYNYMYGYVLDNERPSFEKFEGNSYETENRYHFLVYYRPIAKEYDQLVGYLNYPHQPR